MGDGHERGRPPVKSATSDFEGQCPQVVVTSNGLPGQVQTQYNKTFSFF